MIAKHTMRCGLAVLLLAAGTVVLASETPLADAAEQADWNQVRKLLDQDVEPNMPQVDGMTALHWAAWHDKTTGTAAVRRRFREGSGVPSRLGCHRRLPSSGTRRR